MSGSTVLAMQNRGSSEREAGGLGAILRPDGVFCGVSCGSKKSLFDTAAEIVAKVYEHARRIEVFDCLCARERLGSTGLGNGIALPHGRLPSDGNGSADTASAAPPEVEESPFSAARKNVLTAFLTLQDAIDYEAPDSQPVDLVFVLITPEKSTEEHLRILALLVEKLSCTELVKSLRACKSPAEAHALLVGK